MSSGQGRIQDTAQPINTARQVLFASLIGTTIEFFDFYIYATAAVLVFPKLFFPASDPASATLASLATFAIAFVARPDRLGALRPLRRPRRPQDHARRGAADDGDFDRRDRRAADLRRPSASPRRCCSRSAASARASASAASGAARCCSRSRTRRPASARGTACSRSSARRSGSSSRASVFLAALELAHRRAVLFVRVAHPVPGERGAGARRPLRPADDYRDAGLPGRADQQRAREGADVRGLPPTIPARSSSASCRRSRRSCSST